jgi:hypothetical protein
VGKKLDRVRGTYRAGDVLSEYQLLTHTKLHFERALTDIVDMEVNDANSHDLHS